MNQVTKLSVVCALMFAFTAPSYAQTTATDASTASSDATRTMRKSGGTTLHRTNKALYLRGASAAGAASALGTNDKGQPH